MKLTLSRSAAEALQSFLRARGLGFSESHPEHIQGISEAEQIIDAALEVKERKPRAPKKWWIKHRNNFQDSYYVALGQISNKDAKEHANPIHGINTLTSFDTEEAFEAALTELRNQGETIQL